MASLDRRQLRMYPLSERAHRFNFADIAVTPASAVPELSEHQREQVSSLARRMVSARLAGRPIILTFGAHLVKNGLAPIVIRLIEEGWVTHLATNGAGSIHDWEFAYIGSTAEDVRANVAEGKFGAWNETGRYINLAVAVGVARGLGYGASVGRMIAEDGFEILAPDELKAMIALTIEHGRPDEAIGALSDLLFLVTDSGLAAGWMEVSHKFKDYSIQHAAWTHGVPFTVHPGIGYDIVHTHPMALGGPLGRGAMWDFLSFAESVSRLEGGVHICVGSAIMAPMIFEKALSMANNLSIQWTGKPLADYYLAVVDIQDGGEWDWKKGEPPMDNPAYYLRFCKSFYRMGGILDYLRMDNRDFMLNLYNELSRVREQ